MRTPSRIEVMHDQTAKNKTFKISKNLNIAPGMYIFNGFDFSDRNVCVAIQFYSFDKVTF